MSEKIGFSSSNRQAAAFGWVFRIENREWHRTLTDWQQRVQGLKIRADAGALSSASGRNSEVRASLLEHFSHITQIVTPNQKIEVAGVQLSAKADVRTQAILGVSRSRCAAGWSVCVAYVFRDRNIAGCEVVLTRNHWRNAFAAARYGGAALTRAMMMPVGVAVSMPV